MKVGTFVIDHFAQTDSVSFTDAVSEVKLLPYVRHSLNTTFNDSLYMIPAPLILSVSGDTVIDITLHELSATAHITFTPLCEGHSLRRFLLTLKSPDGSYTTKKITAFNRIQVKIPPLPEYCLLSIDSEDGTFSGLLTQRNDSLEIRQGDDLTINAQCPVATFDVRLFVDPSDLWQQQPRPSEFVFDFYKRADSSFAFTYRTGSYETGNMVRGLPVLPETYIVKMCAKDEVFYLHNYIAESDGILAGGIFRPTDARFRINLGSGETLIIFRDYPAWALSDEKVVIKMTCRETAKTEQFINIDGITIFMHLNAVVFMGFFRPL